MTGPEIMVALINAHPELKRLFGERVFPGMAQPTETQPFLVYLADDTSDTDQDAMPMSLGTGNRMRVERALLGIVGRTYQETQDCKNELMKLQGYRGAIAKGPRLAHVSLVKITARADQVENPAGGRKLPGISAWLSATVYFREG